MAYPTIDEVQGLLEWELSAEDRTMAENTLAEVIIEARSIGREWSNATMPAIVAKCIRACMVRYLRRPDGYIQSRAGDETLAWAAGDRGAVGFPRFTAEEVALIQETARGGRMPQIGSFGTTPQGYTAYNEVDYPDVTRVIDGGQPAGPWW